MLSFFKPHVNYVATLLPFCAKLQRQCCIATSTISK